MKLLNIIRSKPDEQVRLLVQGASKGNDAREVALYEGKVDYDQLVKDIFDAEKVICWW